MNFPNSSIDAKLGFWNIGLKLSFQIFPNSQRERRLGFLNVALAGLLNFLQFMEDIEHFEF